MENVKSKPCMLCGVSTTGSVGAAGIRWSRLCQPCKDSEDNALAQHVKAQGDIMKALGFSPFGGK